MEMSVLRFIAVDQSTGHKSAPFLDRDGAERTADNMAEGTVEVVRIPVDTPRNTLRRHDWAF